MKVHIDKTGYKSKPKERMAAIKPRTQSQETIVDVALEFILREVEAGKTISPAVMVGGCKAENWTEQQLFMVDIDNDTVDTALLMVDDALQICQENGISPAFAYYSYSHTDSKPKYRLGFVMDEVIREEHRRKIIIETLISLFDQADKGCKNADRTFFGTNKDVIFCNEDSVITYEDIIRIYKPQQEQPLKKTDANKNYKIEGTIYEGQGRDNNLVSCVGLWITTGTTDEYDLLSMALSHTKQRHAPPLEEKDVERIVKSILNKNRREANEHEEKPEPNKDIWEPIIPLDYVETPEFPVKSFEKAEWLKNFMEELSEETQTDVALSGTPILSVLATCLQNKYQIEVKSGWVEQLSIYSIVALDPSERKSPVISKLIKPIHAVEIEENIRRDPLIKRKIQEKNLLDKKIEHVTKIIAKGGKGSEGAEERLEGLIRDKESFEMIYRLNLTADDVTPEKLSSLICDNNGNMSILSPEGGIIGTMSGRYSKHGSVNLDVFLKAWNGEYLKIDRQSRESVHISRPALSIGLSMQPVVMNSFIENLELRERGLCARFLYSKPKSIMGKRNFDCKSMTRETFSKYSQNIQKLLNIEHVDAGKEPRTITLKPEAKEISREFNQTIEKRLVGDLDFLRDWAGKLHGQISRIAGLLHIAENINEDIENPFNLEVSRDTYQRAIQLGVYYLQNAINIFSNCSGNEEYSSASYLLDKLKKLGKLRINKRDLNQKVKGKLDKLSFEHALDLLEEHNYLRLYQVDKKVGRPAFDVLINPNINNS